MQEDPRTYPLLTKDFIKKLLRSDSRTYYRTKQLNEKLYLHFKGFHRIENLQKFTGLKALYLESNAIEQIEGLSTLTLLKCLYLHENAISRIEGLEALSDLDSLNLSDNLIEKVEGLEGNAKLNTLLLQRNSIGVNGLSDLQGLLCLSNLSVLDISNNKIEDEAVLTEVLKQIPNLKVLHLNGNPFCKKIPNYRKVVIACLSNLVYLDDRPIFEDERLFAESFVKGGLQAEREQRRLWSEEKEAERVKQHQAFKEFISRGRAEAANVRSPAPATSFYITQQEYTSNSLIDHLANGLSCDSSEGDVPYLQSPLCNID